MTFFKPVLLACALVAPPAWAQTSAASSHAPEHHAASERELSSGEIRRIDMNAGKVTLKHGEIKNLDMPGMTMVFSVQDKALLAPFKAGDKVRFYVIEDKGQYVITEMQPAQ